MRSKGLITTMVVGENIRKATISQGLSLGMLSDKLDITLATISKIERWVIDGNLSRIEQIADVLGIDPLKLFSGEVLDVESEERIIALKKAKIEKLDIQILDLQKQIISLYDELKVFHSKQKSVKK